MSSRASSLPRTSRLLSLPFLPPLGDNDGELSNLTLLIFAWSGTGFIDPNNFEIFNIYKTHSRERFPRT